MTLPVVTLKQAEAVMADTLEHQVDATPGALALLKTLKEKYGSDLIFHQSGGCCDGSSPMCFPANDFRLGGNDVQLGEIDGVPFYMNEDQHKRWAHTRLTIDVVPGMGGMFSLDNGTGQRFLTRSEVCTADDEPKTS